MKTNVSVSTNVHILEKNLNTILRGQQKSIRHMLSTLLAGGHVLLEDLPGTGKTTLAKALAKSVGGKFARIQFTPDLMPSDITGTNIYNPREQTFVFHPGAVFCNILLADEINRASPRTQSALLEAMEERQVSNDGKTLELPHPFLVIATENPVELQGTFALPEAQLDRFMTKLSLGYVSEEQEVEILKMKLLGEGGLGLQNSNVVIDLKQLEVLQQQVQKIHVSEVLLSYIAKLVHATRTHLQVKVGSSTRGSIALLHLAQALSYLDGQDFVTPAQIKEAFPLVMGHRLILKNASSGAGGIVKTVLEDCLNATPAPL